MAAFANSLWVGTTAHAHRRLHQSHKPVRGRLDSAIERGGADLSTDEFLASPVPAALTADRLLIGLLQFDPVTDIDLERSLTIMRHALLHNAVSHAADNDAGDRMTEQLLDSACALAS